MLKKLVITFRGVKQDLHFSPENQLQMHQNLDRKAKTLKPPAEKAGCTTRHMSREVFSNGAPFV